MATKNIMKEQAKTARNSAIALGAAVLIIVILSCIALFGFGHGVMVRYMKPWGQALNYDQDLRGGVTAVYQAQKNGNNANAFDDYRNSIVTVLQNRLEAKNISLANVTTQGTDSIRIEIANGQDATSVMPLLVKSARVAFKDAKGNILLENKDIQSVRSTTEEEKHLLSFTVTADGANKLKEASGEAGDQPISVEFDGTAISATITPTTEGSYESVKTADMPAAQASETASLIQSGSLPMDIVQTEMALESAALGDKTLSGLALAGFIAGALLLIFMLWRYRLPGVAGILSLIVYVLIVIFVLAVSGARISMLGVVGIVLGIGLAIDANILIFERFREEIKAGKQPGIAARTTFRNAFSVAFSASITVIIVSLVLLQFGNDTVRSFALVLLVSLVCGIFTVSVVMRLLLNLLVNLGIKGTKYYVA